MSISDDSTTRLHRILLTSALSGMTPFMERKSVGMVKIDWSKVPKTILFGGEAVPVTHVAFDEDGYAGGTWFAYTAEPEHGFSNYWNNPGDSRFEDLGAEVDLHWANGTPWDQTLTEVPWAKNTSKPAEFGKKDIIPWRHVCVRRDGKVQVFTSDASGKSDVFRFDDIDNGLSLTNYTEDLCGRGPGGFDIVKVYELSARQLAHALRNNDIAAYIQGPYCSLVWTRKEENSAKKALEADVKATENKLAAMKAELDAMK